MDASDPITIDPKASASRVPFLLVVLALLFFNTVNGIWLALDERPLVWDHHSHYARALKFSYFLHHGHRLNLGTKGVSGEVQRFQDDHPAAAYLVEAPIRGYVSFAQGLYMGPKHPPAVHAIGGTATLLAGRRSDGVVFCVNLLFSAILVLSASALASRVAGPWAGAIAAWVVALMPGHFVGAHVLMLDMPLSAAVALAWWAVFRSDGFADRRASVVAGAALGFGWLVKETFPVFVLPLLAWPLWVALRDARARGFRAALRDGVAGNLLRAAGAGALVCGFWYLPHLPRMPAILLKHQAMGAVESDPAWWQAGGALYYPAALINLQASFLFVAGGLAFLPFFLRRHGASREGRLLLAGVLVPLLLFTLLSNKDPRYTVPVLALAGPLLACGLAALRPRAIAAALAALLVAAGLVQSLQVGFGLFGRFETVALARSGGDKGLPAIQIYTDHPALRTKPKPAPEGAAELARILRAARDRAEAEGRDRLEVRHLFDAPEITAPVEQALVWPNLDARFTGRGVRVELRSGFFDPAEQIAGADLVLVKRGGFVGESFLEEVREAERVFEENRGDFELVGALQGPGGHVVEAYAPRRER